MVIPHAIRSKSSRRAAGVALAACALALTGCSDDVETPDATTPDTLAEEQVIGQQPDTPNDVSDGSGEGGNRTGEGDPAPGTGAP